MDLEQHLQGLRKFEIECVREWFRPSMRVLEIGGGSGYQASLITSYGCEVFSIDLDERADSEKTYFDVKTYDGQNIPFADESFDLVFSSNVLEHVESPVALFEEIRRVLKPKGTMIHILPSATWRFWTSVTHYIYLLKCLLRGRVERMGKEAKCSFQDIVRERTVFALVKQILIAGPHGVYPNAISELYYFSQFRWLAFLKKNGFDLCTICKHGLFYTGYGLFSSLSIATRKKMSGFMGSSCHIFVVRVGLE